jgi:hypothetical protein
MGVEDRCHILMITAGHDDMSDELADVPAIVAARACLVDQGGTGSRSQIRIEATSMVPWYMSSMSSRLS